MTQNKIHILLIDDDKYFRMAIKSLLEEHAIFSEASNEAEANELISGNHYDMALIDMEIDGPMSGIKLLKQTKEKGIHSIIISSQSDEDIIEKAYNSGCNHFLTKIHYRNNLEPYIHQYKKSLSGFSVKSLLKTHYITQDKELIERVKTISKINLKGKTILITGETGVGKSLIGELLHYQTYDQSKPFVHINCSEIPENLIESELFGHEKGAFTGALNKKIGKLELANGGTLFLDEIGTMPLIMQQKLLKAIESKIFYPVGSESPTRSDFTLITATCDDLFQKIHEGTFRKDFFFRVSGIDLDIKPLRDRPEDIPLLVKHFVKKSPRRFVIKEEAVEKLKRFNWPGNIRQLKKQIEILSSSPSGIINIGDIDLGPTRESSLEKDSWLTKEQREYIENYGLRDFISKVEEESLKETLSKHKGKITHTIKELRISVSAFYRIFDKLKVSI